MGGFSRRRARALVAAWIAAYALVLNVILASTLLAGQSPVQLVTGHEFCLAAADGAPGDSGQPAKAVPIRCPLCLGQHVSATPPPLSPALAIRIAFSIRYEVPPATPFVALRPSPAHQPRGPPALT
ncbi:DUF2946 family protein [Rhodopseudomonas palustris]|nr:DUF2946 family protein [Rhodopseudomonas palustris]RIA01985.1 DUF2946 domain-containing protein [Rhodopseudomonas palustris]